MVAGGSATNPEGDLVVRLFDGAIGPTQLSQAQAVASLNAAQRLNFSMDLAPAEPRVGGFARVTGSVPLASSSNKPPGLVLCVCVTKKTSDPHKNWSRVFIVFVLGFTPCLKTFLAAEVSPRCLQWDLV